MHPVTKQDALRMLQEAGAYTSSKSSLHCLLQQATTQHTRVRESTEALQGTVWEVVLHTDAFWEELADFEFIGLLAKTCKGFRYAVPWNESAWAKISARLPALPQQCASEIFCTNVRSRRQTTTQIMCDAFAQRGGAKGLFRARQRSIMKRVRQHQPLQRTRWPEHVLYTRAERLLLDMLLTIKCPQSRKVCVTWRDLVRNLLPQIKSHVTPRAHVCLLNRFIFYLCSLHPLAIWRQWHCKALSLHVDLPALLLALRPRTAARMLRLSVQSI
eukprot:659317-Rhodomonas_salina.1